jgi:hypothetical protein
MTNESEYGTQKWLLQKTPVATGKVRYGIPDLLATSKTADVKRELVKMCQAFGGEVDDWQLLENPLGFPDAQTQANWTTKDDRWDVKDILTIGHLETDDIKRMLVRNRKWEKEVCMIKPSEGEDEGEDVPLAPLTIRQNNIF